MFSTLRPQVSAITSSNKISSTEKMQAICELLKENVPYYDWVGFYFRNGDKEELKLGPVAVSNQNFVVPDVKAQDNYIACSITVKAEIVVPLFLNGVNIGQIDIDSNTPDPFSEEDEHFLEYVNQEVSKIL